MKNVNALELFGPKMIEDAKKCRTADEIMTKVIMPEMGRINIVTGQDNDPKYMAYMLQYVVYQLESGEN